VIVLRLLKNIGQILYSLVTNSKFLIALGLCIILFLIAFSGLSWEHFVSTITGISIEYMLLIISMSLVHIYISAVRWRLLLGEFAEIKETKSGYFSYYTAMGLVANNLLPHLGNFGVKTAAMKTGHGVPVVTGSVIVFIKQLYDLIVMITMMIPAVLYFTNITPFEATLQVILGIFLTMCALFYLLHGFFVKNVIFFYEKLCYLLMLIPLLKGKKIFDQENIISFAKMKKAVTLKMFILSYFRNMLHIVRFYVIALALNIDISLGIILLATPIVSVLVIVVSVPGSLGTQEAGWFGILLLFAISKLDIAAFVIGTRIIGELALAVSTLICYLYFRIYGRATPS
jgi:uncharacterized protein (TIRG00374 family)